MPGIKPLHFLKTHSFLLPVLIMGFSGMIAQILLLRELLVIFSGNELSIGIILAQWLILEAGGAFLFGRIIEHRKNKKNSFVVTGLIFSISLPVSLYLCRVAKTLMGITPGTGVGVIHMILLSFFILLPVSVTHGTMFPFACKIYRDITGDSTPSIGKVYIFEIAGTGLGGIIFTYIFVQQFHSFIIVWGIVFVNLVVCLGLTKPFPRTTKVSKILFITSLVFLSVILLFLISGLVEQLHWSSVKKQWAHMDVLFYKNSAFGNVVVTKQDNQFDFYTDGIPYLTLPAADSAFTEDFVHFPMLTHPKPGTVLVIGGGPQGVMKEIAKHPIAHIDYVELDPIIFSILDTFASPDQKKEWHNPQVTLHCMDGRHYVRTVQKKYDVILLGFEEPRDLQVNRFFTLEFFHLIRECLNDDGLFILTLPGSFSYLNRELKKLNRCIFDTLKTAFSCVEVIPGDTNLIVASVSKDPSFLTPQLLAERFAHRTLETRMITPYYISYRLEDTKKEWFKDAIKNIQVKPNSDYLPSGVFYSLSLWNARFSPYLKQLFHILEKIHLHYFIIIISGIIVIFFIIRILKGNSLVKIAIPYALITTGFCGMLFDLIIIFCFQILYGYVYEQIGILIAFFMAGTGIGGSVSSFLLPRKYRTFLFLEAGIILFCALLFVLISVLFPLWQVKQILPFLTFLFPLLSLTGGILIGTEFPLAFKLHITKDNNIGKKVGFLNALDLVGGWLGGMLGGVVLLPLLGLGQTSIVLIMLKVSAFMCLLLCRGKKVSID